MKLAQANSLTQATIQPKVVSKVEVVEAAPVAQDTVETKSESRAALILKTAAAGAAYGAAVGTASGLLYSNVGEMSATAIHMGAIVAGAAGGAVVIGNKMEPVVEKPFNYALGALTGAGVTWGTSAFGLLHKPLLGGVTGAALGGIYGAIAGFIASTTHPSESAKAGTTKSTPNANQTFAGTPSQGQVDEAGLPKKAWSGMAIAYGVGGVALGTRVAMLAASGRISAGMAAGGAAVAAGALLNGYLLQKWVVPHNQA
jgi:hypothetical protein